MNISKALITVLALSFSLTSLALTDDESLEFNDAVTEGKLKIVQKYVNADPTAANFKTFGWSPLQMAANKGNIEMAKYLLSKGADINYIHPTANHTAFMLSAFNHQDEMVKLLAKSGADVNVKLKGDVSLIRFFRDEGDTKMVELLTSLGVKDDGCQEDHCF
jgi:ankyrin repeat protein